MKKSPMIDAYARNELTADETTLYCDDPSMTRQEFADECDINVIMERYEKTGVISHVQKAAPMYLDYTAVPDNLADAMAMLNDADTAFMSLPAKVRREFDNDPLKFVDFAQKPENLDQMRQWELAPPAPKPEPKAPDLAPPPAPPKPTE